MKNVATIIVSYGSVRTLPAALASVAANGISNIIVVENGSQPTTQTLAEQAGAKYLHLPHNPGFASACNQGALLAGEAEYLLFLNPDAKLASSLQRVIAWLEATPRIGAVGLGLVDKGGRPQKYAAGQPVTPLSLFVRHFRPGANPGGRIQVGWVSGAALIVRQIAFTEVGRFDPQFFMYWEDVDLCRRVAAAGWEVWYDPTTKVVHERGTSHQNMAQKTALYDTSADKYFRKYYSEPIWHLQHLARRIYRWFSPQGH